MSRGVRRLTIGMAWLAVLLGLVVVIVLADPVGVLFYVSYAGIGGFLAMRRPQLAVGWLLVLEGVGLGLGNVHVQADAATLAAGILTPMQAFTAWADGTAWAISFVAAAGVALVFPDAPLPRPTRRPIAFLLIAGSVVVAMAILFGPLINVTPGAGLDTIDVANPFAMPPFAWLPASIAKPDSLYPILFLGVVGGIVALVGRYRASIGLVRVQFRWLAFAMVVVGITTANWAVVTVYLRVDDHGLGIAAFVLAYVLVPVTIAIAVLRYRLYDIDRVISRTVGWAVATAAVLGVLVVGVLILQTALVGFTQGQTLATAASTLFALVLFQPVRRRVQRVVDRRFDRPRVEAERTVSAHGERLAHETDLPTIEAGVLETVATTLRPASASLWIRRRDRPHAIGS